MRTFLFLLTLLFLLIDLCIVSRKTSYDIRTDDEQQERFLKKQNRPSDTGTSRSDRR